MKTEDAFREIRLAWFNRIIKSYSHERIWEDEEALDLRDKQNKELLEKYNDQTERIINGENLNITPYSSYDINKNETISQT